MRKSSLKKFRARALAIPRRSCRTRPCYSKSLNSVEECVTRRMGQDPLKQRRTTQRQNISCGWRTPSVVTSSQNAVQWVLFAVDLDLPDALLHQQFKTQIERLRFMEQESGLPPPKRFARPDFEFWIRMGILPYLDLTLWAYLNDLNIPNRVMADAIYSDDEGDPDRVRKVTKVWADDLTRSEHAGAMKQLKVQAALEASTSVNAERETD
jgi:Family of unknown function (DUF6387)